MSVTVTCINLDKLKYLTIFTELNNSEPKFGKIKCNLICKDTNNGIYLIKIFLYSKI